MTLAPAPFHAELADGPQAGQAYWLHADDGVRLRLAVFPAPQAKGTVLLFPGRTEYIEKYGRNAADLVACGYSVAVVDWRGQGLADRLLDEPLIGHVDRFADYQRDVTAVTDALTQLELPRPWHLIAHSMGGCIGLRALMNGLPVQSAAFTAPMWGIRMSAFSRPAAWVISWGGSQSGLGHVLVPGTRMQSYVASEPFETNSLTNDPAMFDYMRAQVTAEPRFQLGGPSLRWLKEALLETRRLAMRPAPQVPCLTFLGTQEVIVDVDRIESRMAHWPGGTLIRVPGAKHEILMESGNMRGEAVRRCDAFFTASAQADASVALSA